MALTQFTTDVNNVQNLPDKPTQSAEELKMVFDKAGNDIKDFLNDVLTKEIDALIKELQSKKIDIQNIVNEIEKGGTKNVASGELVKGLSETIENKINSLKKEKLDITGGTLTGNLFMDIFKILFSNNGCIEWKEDGYGDKFRIISDFNGPDDSNVLKIQGAVGDAGTNPDYIDLFIITAKNGNIQVKGAFQANGGLKGSWEGFYNEMNVENVNDTWLVVMNNNKLQHRTIPNIIQSYLKSGATTTITSGSSNPSGGNNGDVYIQYF